MLLRAREWRLSGKQSRRPSVGCGSKRRLDCSLRGHRSHCLSCRRSSADPFAGPGYAPLRGRRPTAAPDCCRRTCCLHAVPSQYRAPPISTWCRRRAVEHRDPGFATEGPDRRLVRRREARQFQQCPNGLFFQRNRRARQASTSSGGPSSLPGECRGPHLAAHSGSSQPPTTPGCSCCDTDRSPSSMARSLRTPGSQYASFRT